MSDQPRITRRDAVKLPAIVAATLALPGVVAAAPAPPAEAPAIVHPALCFHEKYRTPEQRPEERAAWEQLRDSCSPEQRRLLGQWESEVGQTWQEEQDRFVDELCAHFPGLAPAIRAVAYHVFDTTIPDSFTGGGTCCIGETA